jgi:hypothetical protein
MEEVLAEGVQSMPRFLSDGNICFKDSSPRSGIAIKIFISPK